MTHLRKTWNTEFRRMWNPEQVKCLFSLNGVCVLNDVLPCTKSINIYNCWTWSLVTSLVDICWLVCIIHPHNRFCVRLSCCVYSVSPWLKLTAGVVKKRNTICPSASKDAVLVGSRGSRTGNRIHSLYIYIYICACRKFSRRSGRKCSNI
jgi:hypothetical protein